MWSRLTFISPRIGNILVLKKVGYPREPEGGKAISKSSFSLIAFRDYSSLSSTPSVLSSSLLGLEKKISSLQGVELKTTNWLHKKMPVVYQYQARLKGALLMGF